MLGSLVRASLVMTCFSSAHVTVASGSYREKSDDIKREVHFSKEDDQEGPQGKSH